MTQQPRAIGSETLVHSPTSGSSFGEQTDPNEIGRSGPLSPGMQAYLQEYGDLDGARACATCYSVMHEDGGSKCDSCEEWVCDDCMGPEGEPHRICSHRCCGECHDEIGERDCPACAGIEAERKEVLDVICRA